MMIEEIGSELLVTGFVVLIRHLSELIHRTKTGVDYPELSKLSHQDYRQFVERFASHREDN